MSQDSRENFRSVLARGRGERWGWGGGSEGEGREGKKRQKGYVESQKK